ncbi:MAG: (E)-4-hydroxy-3-methylbut-2-enyl-diphosphate synthase [Marinilabiliaceae bacterium]|nr:(E)-4-hydroxy-3-methylbut-2-enyl-diphosphate synthase [Marinilabiliaceae bacterium]
MVSQNSYCDDLFNYRRNQTCEVKVGNKIIGGDHPIQIQSMTTTNTLDVQATADQVIRLLDAGADIVRITTQGRREARQLEPIKQILTAKGYVSPLVADIHFNPNAAEIAAQLVEKVRINPGNFVGGAKKFDLIDYSEDNYREELEIVKQKLIPFLDVCKRNGTAIRVGTNHGSLSDRIMSRYGDTPQGMVEACMEYLRICRAHDFNAIVLSIKSSNTRIMVHTVRLLVAAMKDEGMNYPLHLGVTEAGSEDEGRIKSAVGSGALLADGLGDTIRVSLTEEPEKEVPVAKKVVDYICHRNNHAEIPAVPVTDFTPYEYNRRKTHDVLNMGGDNVPVVIGRIGRAREEQVPDFYWLSEWQGADVNSEQKYLIGYQEWKSHSEAENLFPVLDVNQFVELDTLVQPFFLQLSYPELTEVVIKKLANQANVVILLSSHHKNAPVEQRACIFKLNQHHLTHPVVLVYNYSENDAEDFQVKSAADAGLLLLDGLADGLCLINEGDLTSEKVTETAFGILQAARVRFTKTEFISCPGCGRTLFNLQETSKQIKMRTSHLKGLKIGVMGCIVNGVGEMADADYGYIGSGPDKVSLFKKRELIKRNLSGSEAVEALIDLIKEHGDWVDPQ